MGGSFAPKDGEALTSLSAIFLPVPVAGGVRLGLRSVLDTPGAARWLWFRTPFCWFFPLLLITGFPAVGDLGQELANVVYFLLCPEMYGDSATCGGLGLRDFSCLDIAAQSHRSNAEFLSRLTCGEGLHSDAV